MNTKKRLLAFVEFEKFYHFYNPLSVYGKRDKKQREIYYDISRLEAEHALIQQGIALLTKHELKVTIIEYALKRISLLNSYKPEMYNSEDIFLIKKYIYNYDQIAAILNDEIGGFALPNPFKNLKKILDQDGNRETFYLSGSYDERLKDTRNNIYALQSQQKIVEKDFLSKLKSEHNIDFRFRNFVVISQAEATNLPEDLFYREQYDSNQVIIKPEYPKEYFELISNIEEKKTLEKKIEQEVLLKLSKQINEIYPELENTILELIKVDRMLAKARLINKFNLTKPDLKKERVNINISEGIFLPLQQSCLQSNRKYQPLSIKFDNRNIVVLGSNMGGKTVLLQTLGFMQLLTQMGFYVPAKKFTTSIFQSICFIGSDNLDKIDGLSSFGREIYQFINRVQNEEDGLFLLDEFAKTTNSSEATGLIIAVLRSMGKKKFISSFWATHFTFSHEINNVSYYKMRGLDHELFDKKQKLTLGSSLEQRIDSINEMMDYRVEKAKSNQISQDALKIAQTLGLDNKILKYALQQLRRSNNVEE